MKLKRHYFTYIAEISSVENHMQTDFSTREKYSGYIKKSLSYLRLYIYCAIFYMIISRFSSNYKFTLVARGKKAIQL